MAAGTQWSTRARLVEGVKTLAYRPLETPKLLMVVSRPPKELAHLCLLWWLLLEELMVCVLLLLGLPKRQN